jgi:hypothetical protein
MSIEASTAPGSVRSKRRWPAFLAGVVLLAAVVPGVWLYRNWAQEQALREVIEELDRTDPGWRFADILAARVPVPDDQNSAVQMRKVFRALGTRSFSLPTGERELFDDLPPAARLSDRQERILRDR